MFKKRDSLGQHEPRTITDISREISSCARNGFLSFSEHAETRLKERSLGKEELTAAIAENGSIVATEKAYGDHNATDERYILLTDIGSMPVRVTTTPKKVVSKGKRYTKYVVVTAYSDTEYFATNKGSYNEQYIRNFTAKRTQRPSRKAYVKAYKRHLEKIKAKDNDLEGCVCW